MWRSLWRWTRSVVATADALHSAQRAGSRWPTRPAAHCAIAPPIRSTLVMAAAAGQARRTAGDKATCSSKAAGDLQGSSARREPSRWQSILTYAAVVRAQRVRMACRDSAAGGAPFRPRPLPFLPYLLCGLPLPLHICDGMIGLPFLKCGSSRPRPSVSSPSAYSTSTTPCSRRTPCRPAPPRCSVTHLAQC